MYFVLPSHLIYFTDPWFFFTAILYKEVKLRLKLIFDPKMRLVLWFEVFVGTPVLVEDAWRCVTHNGILSFVRAFKDAFQRLQLLFIKARLWREKVNYPTDCKSNTFSTFGTRRCPDDSLEEATPDFNSQYLRSGLLDPGTSWPRPEWCPFQPGRCTVRLFHKTLQWVK